MTLRDEIEGAKRRAADAAADQVNAHAEEWTSKGLSEALDAARDLHGPEGALAIVALEALAKRQGELVQAGKPWVLEALSRFGAGRLKAEDLQLISRSSFEERRAALHAAIDAAHADHLARAEARRQLLRVAQEVGAAAIRAAIPLLIAAAGI